MGYDAARQQHIEWLQKQIAEKKSALSEVEAMASQLRGDIQYFELILQMHKQANTTAPSSDENTHLEIDGEANQIKTNQNVAEDNAQKRSPKDMLRAELKNKTLAEVAEIALNSHTEALSADDIARVVFVTQDAGEYERARNSLSTELRRGAKEGKWQQVGRGSFASDQVATHLRQQDSSLTKFASNGSYVSN